MAVEWRNNKQPVDGLYIADVDAEDGSQPQTFSGTSIEDVADKLLNAQFHATRRINTLKKDITPDPKKRRATFTPRKLTPDEQFQAGMDLRDPTKIQEVVDRTIEATLGAPLAVVRKKLQDVDDREITEAATAAAMEFASSTPDWYPTQDNKLKLWDYLADNNLELTAKNFGIAFDRLMNDGLLDMKPETVEEPDTKPEERIAPQPVTRPRGSFASGVRSDDVSGSPSPGTRSKPRYTREQIETMPKPLYAHKLINEAGFAQAVNQVMTDA